jgi:hypothetical protein
MRPMEQEKFFKCPYCFEKISMLLDLSEDDTQSYIEDCEVCCHPIQVTFTSANGQLVSFHAAAT